MRKKKSGAAGALPISEEMIPKNPIPRIPSVLPEVQTFHTFIRLSGSSIKSESLQAVDRFVRDCYNAGVWSKLVEVYPFCGDDLTAAMAKLKNFAAAPALTAVNMVASDYVERGSNGGIAGNGTTKYLNTNFAQYNIGATAHMSVYLRENEAGGSTRYWLAANSQTPTIEQTIIGTTTGSNQQGMLGGNSASAASANPPNAGFYYVERSSSTDLQLWHQNVSVASSAVAATPAYQSLNLFVCARNANGAPSNYSAKKVSFCSIGLAMTAAERTAFYNAVVGLQTNLERNV